MNDKPQEWSKDFLYDVLRYATKYPTDFEHIRDGLYKPTHRDVDLIVNSVNACANIPNPEQTIAELVELLGEASIAVGLVLFDKRINIGIRNSLLEWVDRHKALLKALTPQKEVD